MLCGVDLEADLERRAQARFTTPKYQHMSVDLPVVRLCGTCPGSPRLTETYLDRLPVAEMNIFVNYVYKG